MFPRGMKQLRKANQVHEMRMTRHARRATAAQLRKANQVHEMRMTRHARRATAAHKL